MQTYTLDEILDRYLDEDYTSERLLGGPFVYTVYMKAHYLEMQRVINITALDLNPLSRLESFAIRVLIMHLEEKYNLDYNKETNLFQEITK